MTHPNGATIGQLHLRRILSTSETGDVALEGTNARILLTGRVTHSDIGRTAVCQNVVSDGDATLVVLGVLADTDSMIPIEEDAPIVLEHGRSSLRMYPDGRIMLRGDDITVDSSAGLRLLAAKIDLN